MQQLDMLALLERPSAAPAVTRSAAVAVHFSDDHQAKVIEDATEGAPIYREHLPRVAVDPKRLDKGGDVDRSYSADTICYDGKLRSTFRLNGGDWVNTGGMWWSGGRYCECYRVVPLELFGEPTSTYATHDWKQAREGGGYHGMRVKHGGRDVVLVGPSIVIIAGQAEQAALL